MREQTTRPKRKKGTEKRGQIYFGTETKKGDRFILGKINLSPFSMVLFFHVPVAFIGLRNAPLIEIEA